MPRQTIDAARLLDETERWWRTSITDIGSNRIRVRGYAIEELMGRISLGEMLWLLARGELPAPAQIALLEAAMLSTADHGPHAPSITVARIAVTCGAAMNEAMAQGAAMLGDIHGGAIQHAMELFQSVAAVLASPYSIDAVVASVRQQLDLHDGFLPGFGHRFHTRDPRTRRLKSLAERARVNGVIKGQFIALAETVEVALERVKGKRVPINIDGIAGAVYSELGFSPALGQGLVVLSRSLGLMAHAWEQMSQGGRIKGPVPKDIGYRYEGPGPREVPSAG